MSIQIEFEFDFEKAIEAIAYLVEELVEVDKVKLTKLLYLADRDHFLKCGYPITGDSQFAMPKGPIPSNCLDVLDGDPPYDEEVFRYLHVEDNKITLHTKPGLNVLTESEKETLDKILKEHGHKDKWKLVDETHMYPEYADVFKGDTSTRIPYELILKYHGDESQYRDGRPVLTRKIREHMKCPFRVEYSLPEDDSATAAV